MASVRRIFNELIMMMKANRRTMRSLNTGVNCGRMPCRKMTLRPCWRT
ncbi:hypothetical protein KIF59_16345 [Enterobacter cloacae subsp. cloacae]|nr:hypothetical protein [Enterobacter cloacae subsp. cloacae]